MKRWLAAIAIFLGSIVVLQALLLAPSLARMVRGRATGLAFVLGSPAENLARIAVLAVLALLAYRLSGRFVKA